MSQPAQPWHMPVRLEDVPETGLHLDLIADEQVRAGLAALTGVVDILRLEAVLDVVRHGNGLRATGRVSAIVGQICVVTLEPLQNEVNEHIDVIFAPSSAGTAVEAEKEAEKESREIADEPEALSDDGVADLGAIAAEFLMLGIDPYPRKPGAAFTPPVEQGGTLSPFAALARIKDAKN